LASLTHYCAACTTRGSSDSSAARRTNRRVFGKILSPFGSAFRLLHALIDVPLGLASTNPHQVLVRVK
jgi:hypothetical protein